MPSITECGAGLYHLVRREGDFAADWYEKAIEEREPFAVIYARSNLLHPIHEARPLAFPGRTDESAASLTRNRHGGAKGTRVSENKR